MPMWMGPTWTCGVCGWQNAMLRKRCRNVDCLRPRGTLPDALHVQAHLSPPPGYHLVKDFFIQPDGTSQDAWVRPDGPISRLRVDYLRPGESVVVVIQNSPQGDKS